MNDKILVRIKVYNKEQFYIRILERNISLNNIKYKDKYIICKIKESDYKTLSRYYKIEILKEFNTHELLKHLKKYYLEYLSIILGIILFNLFINTICYVDIRTTNRGLASKISKVLDIYNLKRFTLKKDYNYLVKVKQELLKTYPDELEWVEIKSDGMKYIITLEERKKILPNTKNDRCDVIATKDALVTKVIAQSGVVMVKPNTYVRAGDVLISGEIKYNEEIKNTVCAKGIVYGEVWYDVKMSLPKTYQEKIYTDKYRYNLELSHNKDYKIFKSRLKDYDTKRKTLISILGFKINLLKEEEIIYLTKEYTEEELDIRIDELIQEKVGLKLKEGEEILYKNILKKELNHSKIDIDVFVTTNIIISN